MNKISQSLSDMNERLCCVLIYFVFSGYFNFTVPRMTIFNICVKYI